MTPHNGQRPDRAKVGASRSWAGEPDPTSVRHGSDTGQQPTLDDLLAEGRRRRDEGVETATHGTDIVWRRVTDEVIAGLAASGCTFDAEDVRAVVGEPPAGSQNAFGARFSHAARNGVIVRVGYRQASRPEAHARTLAVWRGSAAA